MKDTMTKAEALKRVAQEDVKPKGYVIKNRFTNSDIFVSKHTCVREAVLEAFESGADLSGADLSGADLYEANLSEANLYEANLSGANLRGANLSGANLYEANLYEANLRGANLSGANLYEANLREAELQNAKFYGKGGTTKIKKNQIDDLFKALGIIVED